MKETFDKFTSQLDVLSKKIYKKPFIFSIGLTLFVLILIWSLFTAFYDSNDDIAMQMISSGKGYTLEPQQTLIFTNIIIGVILKRLYNSFQDISFYPLYMFCMIALSVWFLFYSFLKLSKPVYWLMPIIAYMIFLFTIKMQFTVIASFTGVAGMVGFILINQNEMSFKTKWVLSVFSICLIVLSSLIRIQSLAFVLLIAIPSLIYLLIKQRTLLIRNNYIFFILTFSLVLGGFIIDYWYYQSDPEWSSYKKIQKSRSKIIDYSKSDAKESDLKLIGLNEIEFKLINEWYTVSPICEPEQIYQLAAIQKYDSGKDDLVKQFGILAAFLYGLFIKNTNTTLMFVLLISFIFVIKPKWLYFTNLLWLLLLFFILSVYFKFPFRLFLSGMTGLILFMLCFTNVDINTALSDKRRKILNTVLFLIYLLAGITIFFKNKSNDFAVQNFKELKCKLDKIQNIGEPIFIWGRGSNFLIRIPVFEVENYVKNIRFIPIGWLCHSPVHRQILKYNNYANSNEFFTSGKSMYLMAKTEPIMLLKNYLTKQHYHYTIIPAEIIENDISLYKIEFY